MNYALRSILKLKVFDEKGKFITELDSLKEAVLENKTLKIYDCLINLDLLKAITQEIEDHRTDYEKAINEKENIKVFKIDFNDTEEKVFKLIASGLVTSADTCEEKPIFYDIPYATVINPSQYASSVFSTNKDPHVFSLQFNLTEYSISIHE